MQAEKMVLTLYEICLDIARFPLWRCSNTWIQHDCELRRNGMDLREDKYYILLCATAVIIVLRAFLRTVSFKHSYSRSNRVISNTIEMH